jgi:hypothetical protein
MLHHHPDRFAPDIDALHKNTSDVLALLSALLDDQFFAYVGRITDKDVQ